MTWSIIITLIAVGFLLVILEIFVLPGFIAGILGGVAVIVGISQAFVHYGNKAGAYTLGSSFVLFVGIMFFFFREKTWTKLALHDVIDGQVNTHERSKVQVGDTGKSVSRISPSGNALINDNIVEVHTTTTPIDPETEIKVIQIDGYKILVKPIQK